MYKNLFMSVAVMATCLSTSAQTIAPDCKGSNNNPISANVFCADPTSLEYNGRLYVYGTNDHQQFIAQGKTGKNDYGYIKSIVVFSTDDMVNWTFHGTIDTQKICAGWQPSAWYKGYGVSWAPSVTWRRNKLTKKDEFFLYFCNSSHGVAVLKAESPIGPWKSPNTELLIHYDTPGANPQGTNANFDPGVTIDDNGVGWLTFGGLGSSTLMPDAARIVKLKPSMTAIDGSAVLIHAPYHFEANELNVIGGKYVYTYCSNWASRDDWNTYKTEHGITASAPGGGTMCYMVSDNPSNPNSWVFKGYYGPGVEGNNHSHLQKFQGEYYHIYHNHGSVLLDVMKRKGIVDNNAGDYRSICVNKATVNESTATINRVSLTNAGVAQIKNMNPYELQQMETMANSGGIEYEDFTNIQNTTVSTLGNDASRNMQVKMKKGSWINVRKVDFGTTGANKIVLRAKGTGTIDIRIGSSPSNSGNTVATLEFSSTDMEDHVIALPADKLELFKGVKNNLYFVVTAADNVYVDSWQFTEADPSGIQELSNSNRLNSKTYDLSGRRLSGAQQHRGIVIKQYTDENGVRHSRKVMSGKE